jgi:hypothetical protein
MPASDQTIAQWRCAAPQASTTLEWSYWVRCDKFMALHNAIALKMGISLSHSNRVRVECDKLHFI